MLLCLAESPLKNEYLSFRPQAINDGINPSMCDVYEGHQWEMPSYYSDGTLSDWSDDEYYDNYVSRSHVKSSILEDYRLSDSFIKWSETQYWRIQQHPHIGY
jgi:hypothetical protein